MSIVKQMGQKSSRKSLKASASILGLAAGTIGWSGLAQAAGDEASSQVMLLPQHYELLENGVVVFKLETGENLSLTADQYLVLEDGLLLITDELAQASIYSLPVMGSVRAKLLTDLEQVATIDGTVAEATPAQSLAITEGQAPRLSEQVQLQSYEVAQASGDNSNTNAAGDALATSMAVAPGAMALLGMLMTSDQPGNAPPSSNESPKIVEADALGRMGRIEFGNSWSSDFDTTGPFINAAGQVKPNSEPSVWPYARATDADGDALVWSLTAVGSNEYTGYDSDYDSPSELLAAFDIFWNDTGSAHLIWSDEIQNWYSSVSGGPPGSDTWTWEITVSDGGGLTDTASISLDFP